ncbi:MAG TPA: AAC(3) family N-acetyltransferase [Anaerolineae bacterium]|nr:AAC(3) family N-acetyltransferase [Anaerolineae bacterium]HPL29745.1 AAC(3) family N-acetyltransferase [Anaerolineae bacterium]
MAWVSIEQLIAMLHSAGITAGDTMLFEAPGTGLDGVRGGLPALAEAVQQAIAPHGTLVVPTCTATEGYPKPTFDTVLSPSEAGPFSEFFRQQPGVLRSHSPTHSVAARGPLAEHIVAGHRSAWGRPTPWGEGPFGHGSPWDVLMEQDAWWIMLDGDWGISPFTSYVRALYAERHAGITKETFWPTFAAQALAQELERRGLLRCADWGSHNTVVFRLRAAVEGALQTLERAPDRLQPSEAFRLWLARIDDIKQHGYLQVGTAKAPITPTVPCARWEGGRLTGVYRDLYARVLVLSRGSSQVALVLCDLLGIAGSLVEVIRTRAHEMSGIPGDAIMVACTHSHSTPDTVGAGNEDSQYLERMVEAIAAAICRAAANTQPARLGWGRVRIRGLAHSRRVRLTDGHVYTTRYGVPSTWRVNPDLIAAEGPIDPDLTVIRVESLDGNVLAAISNLGCHASVALMSPSLSGDYPGEAMLALERALGEPSIALCTIGSAADIDPTLEMPFWGPRNDANATRLGRILAAQVLECLERVQVVDEVVVGAARVPVDLAVRDDWVRMLEAEQERLGQEFASAQVASPVVARLLQQRIIHTEVQALRLNDLVLVGLPGEVFTSTGLKLKGLMAAQTAIVQLANDYVGYILTPEAEREGGYETGLHFWTRVRSEAEEQLLGAVMRVVDRLLT